MHGAITQRSASGVSTAATARFTDLLAFKTRASKFGFQRWQLERCGPSRQSFSNVRPVVVRVDATVSGSGGNSIAPLQPESPAGQLLVELLRTHPHLFSAAAEQQLDKLAEDRNAANGNEASTMEGDDSVLYKRIAELRAQQRRSTVEDIMYALVSYRFLEAHISMVPPIPSLAGNKKVDILSMQDRKLQSVHSREALEMVWEHLAFIMGVNGAAELVEDSIMVPISKPHMGQIYAISALYGYFLRRVDEKFQMEKILAPSPSEPKKQGQETKGRNPIQDDSFAAEMVATILDTLGINKQDSGFMGGKEQSTNLLRKYVLSFEVDTLFRCVRIRSMESACIIERQTEALFGKPGMADSAVEVRKEESMILSLAGLKSLILEAVAFGSFLWDAETFVDSRYTIVAPEGQ